MVKKSLINPASKGIVYNKKANWKTFKEKVVKGKKLRMLCGNGARIYIEISFDALEELLKHYKADLDYSFDDKTVWVEGIRLNNWATLPAQAEKARKVR